ncbi:MAG: methylated-DNA--[protein]-cysteine S-methyltransferase [Gammaproteobacteria bacterium]|nr:methylated-DNA--[protein]-cysteine S-methyltransferase [Gammaproteobacteria bacterium]MCP5199870.1 methylated-DNA--[protein]-cysteine S-methyltransferase [Gammaproteobacteria bacterium]
MTALWRDTVATPLGELVVLAADDGLKAVEFAAADRRIERLLARRYATAEIVPLRDPLGAVTALVRYFDGQLDALADLPRAAPGTAFQQRLWAVLGDIPPGRTTTYGALAAQLGRPRAARAVGAANGANPLAIVVPCHRVLGADGALTGYAGGTWRKRWLLDHEARHAG